MKGLAMKFDLLAVVGLLALPPAAIAADAAPVNARAKFSTEVAHDVSRPLSSLSRSPQRQPSWLVPTEDGLIDIRPERAPIATGRATRRKRRASPESA
jgi:hypothetical protein